MGSMAGHSSCSRSSCTPSRCVRSWCRSARWRRSSVPTWASRTRRSDSCRRSRSPAWGSPRSCVGYVVGRFGVLLTMDVSLALLVVFGLVRSAGGRGGRGAVLDVADRHGDRVGRSHAADHGQAAPLCHPRDRDRDYTTAIQLGSTLSAALAVPLALALGGWRSALAAFAFAGGLSLVAWLLIMRGRRASFGADPTRPDAQRVDPPAEDRERPGSTDAHRVLGGRRVSGGGTPSPGCWRSSSGSARFRSTASWRGSRPRTRSRAGPRWLPGPWSHSWAGRVARIAHRRLGCGPGWVAPLLARRLLGGARRGHRGTRGCAVGRRLGARAGAMLGAAFTLASCFPSTSRPRPPRPPGSSGSCWRGLSADLDDALAPGRVRDATGSFTASLWLNVVASVLLLVVSLPFSRARMARWRLATG